MRKFTFLASALLLVSAMVTPAFTAQAQETNLVSKLSLNSQYQGLVPEEVLWERGNLFWTYASDANNKNDGFNKLSLYNSELSLIKTITDTGGVLPCNYTDSYRSDYRIPVTQDVFKDDSKFEYITAARLDEEGHIAEIAIKQDDGKTLSTISFGDGYVLEYFYYGDWDGIPLDVINLDSDHWYLCVHLVSEAGRIIRLYSFQHGNVSAIKKVKDIPSQARVSPIMPRKNEAIKVDLSDIQSPSSISVVSADGKTVYSKALERGQKESTIETSHLTAGMYIIRVADSTKEYDNCKVIIR